MSHPRRKLRLAVAIAASFVALSYLAIMAYLFVGQRDMLFFPTKGDASRLEALRTEGEALSFVRDDATLEGVLLLPSAEPPRGTVMYFGGNAEPVLEHADSFAPLRAQGLAIALVPYRGYDQSTGKPGADALRADAIANYDALVQRPELAGRPVIAFGYSMGSGVAVALAAERPVAGVLLAAPYARLSDLAADAYPWLPVRWLFRHEFDSEALAPGIQAPALILHGSADPVIPLQHARRLQSAWGGEAQLIELDGVAHDGMGRRTAEHPRALHFVERLRAP